MTNLQNDVSGFIAEQETFIAYYKGEGLPKIYGGNSVLEAVRRHGKLFYKKTLIPQLQYSPPYIDSHAREFEIGYMLDHPHIMRYIDKGTDDSGPYLITEFIDGITLSECRKQRTKLNEKDIVRIILQVLDALDYLHTRQIYHGDIKPANILLTFKGGNVKLIDFGHVNRDGYYFKSGGTKDYVAPEQVWAVEKTGPQSDIYAVGRLAAFLDAGDPHEVHLPSKRLSAFTEKCTKEDMDERFQSAKMAMEMLTEPPFNIRIVMIIAFTILLSSLLLLLFMLRQNENQILSSPVHRPIKGNAKDTLSGLPAQVTKIVSSSRNSKEPSTALLRRDSVYASDLGNSAFKAFQERKEALKEVRMDELCRMQGEILDSVSKEWFRFSSRYEPMSLSYRKAFESYQPALNESNRKIMKELFPAAVMEPAALRKE